MFGKKERRITRILIVEDEPLIAFDTEHMLSTAGYAIVATCDTVAEACALIASETPIDLVIADVNLADGSGVDVARAAHAREILVLFVTGNCPPDARALAVGCLKKPYAPRDLTAAIGAIERVSDGKGPRRVPSALTLFVAPS